MTTIETVKVADPAVSVRLMYVHLPSIAVAYLAFLATLVGSVVYLRGTVEGPM